MDLGEVATPEFAAIINPLQSGILAVGAARPQPAAARWLAAFTARVENPLSLLVW